MNAPVYSADSKPLDFAHQIVPILKKHCVECHGDKQAKGGFSINTRELFLENDAAIPGKPKDSYFLDLVTSPDPEVQMPPYEKDRLSDKEIQLLKEWVTQKMPWEAGFSFAESAYEPPLQPRRPELPAASSPNRSHPIDRIIDHYLTEQKQPLPETVSDDAFVRRVYLDLNGLLPTPEQRQEFLRNNDPDKRAKLVQALLNDQIAYADHWLTFWNDLLRNDYTGTGFITGGRKQISGWLYSALVQNKPYNQLARELIAPAGDESRGFIDGIKWRGDVSAGQTLEIQFSQSISQSFLGINMKCASCHDSFIDRWTLQEAYGLAAIYSQRPLEIHRCDKPIGEQAKASWVFPELGNIDPAAARDQRLQQLAELMTHPQNGRFTRTIVNRLWCQLMGRGIVHPVDAMQTEPWNADLIDHLAMYLSDHDYDLRQLLFHIATSKAYQARTASSVTEGSYVYNGPQPRRLTAEQFLDAVWQITNAAPSSFEAPVIRSTIDPDQYQGVELTANWLWGDSAAEGKAPAAGETIMLRKTFTLDEIPETAIAVYTCDNAAIVYLNGREVSSMDNWAQPATILLKPHLKKGANQLVIRATNAGNSPNLAGLNWEARFKTGDEITSLVSDASWEWNPNANTPKEGRLGGIKGEWKPVTVVPAIAAWNNSTVRPMQEAIAMGIHGQSPKMVRASLKKNDFLMTALGRPNRDQIVTSRPQELTTLEAINLANGESLMTALRQGADTLKQRFQGNTRGLISYIYEFAYSRNPSEEEASLLLQELGPDPSIEQIQDLLWIICLSPEFMYVN